MRKAVKKFRALSKIRTAHAMYYVKNQEPIPERLVDYLPANIRRDYDQNALSDVDSKYVDFTSPDFQERLSPVHGDRLLRKVRDTEEFFPVNDDE